MTPDLIEADLSVLVVEDDDDVREALGHLLASVGIKVETYASVPDFMAAAEPAKAGCLVLDIRLPGRSGLALQQDLHSAGITVPVIFLTGVGDVATAVRAMKSGACDFMTKPLQPQEFIEAVQRAMDQSVEAQRVSARQADLEQRYSTLSNREKQVLPLVASGLVNKRVALIIGVTEATVKLHRGNLMRKMGAGSIADLVRMNDQLRPSLDRLNLDHGRGFARRRSN